MKILVLGATGMLGHTLLSFLSEKLDFDVSATVRSHTTNQPLPFATKVRIIPKIDAYQVSTIQNAINSLKPTVVINCIGIIKQLQEANDPVKSISVNSLLPHQLAQFCGEVGARLIHISTDCVFSGQKGGYTEADNSDATDLYGQSKFLGELRNYAHCLTLRTSIIGHELRTHYGLIEWFLSQSGQIKGFTKAIYTGFPTIELARIITDHVLSNTKLHGLYQVASQPISKYDLLKIVASKYKKDTQIVADDSFYCDRSLKSDLFNATTGYKSPSWEELISRMHIHYQLSPFYN